MPNYASGEHRTIFFVPTLDAGGAERVCVNYVNHLRHPRPILVLIALRGPLMRDLHPDIPVFTLDSSPGPKSPVGGWVASPLWSRSLTAKFSRFIKRSYKLHKIARHQGCDAIVSFTTVPNLMALCSKILFDQHLKVVINVHDTTSRILLHSKIKRWTRTFFRLLIPAFYRQADLIIAIAQGVKQDLNRSFAIPARKIVVIHNPIDLQMIYKRATEPITDPWLSEKLGYLIVAAGRLVKLKGFDLLIESVGRLSKKLNVRLIIVGDGEERANLRRLIARLRLGERVMLAGYQENPWKYIGRADIFVMSSLTEGFPNVITEALALGRAVVATDCSPGVRESLRDGRFGLLVPPGDVAALSSGLHRLLVDIQLRNQFSRRASERAMDFELQATVGTYENLLKAVVERQ